jgi:hypothetical protein
MSAISVAKIPCYNPEPSIIEVRYHFLRDNVEKENMDLNHVPTQKQLTDSLKKPLGRARFARLWGELMVIYPF